MNASNELKKKACNDRSFSGQIVTKLSSFGRFLKASYKTVILVAIVAIVSVAGSALVSMTLSASDSEVYLPSLATIKTIGVETYWDIDGENKRETLDWDEIKIEKLNWDDIKANPVNATLYVKSVSNYKVTLNMFLTDWDPNEISEYLTISWDYNGTIIDPNEIVPVTLTLSPSSSEAFIKYIVENEVDRFVVDVHFVASE